MAESMTLAEKQTVLVEEITIIPDHHERLGYVIDRGRNAPTLEPDLHHESFKIEGCMSSLWVVPEYRDGKCRFISDSDSAIVKGIAALLCEFYSGHEPAEILANDAVFLGEIGITQHLSPNRRNGLSRIIETIHRFAKSCMEEPGS